MNDISKDLCILVFGHTRPLYIADVLESLKKQNAISNVDVWLDGHQAITGVRYKTDLVREVVSNYSVRNVRSHNGMLGFRKMILHALNHAAHNYRYIIILEDDCFPTGNAVKVFIEELEKIEFNNNIFSVYGHPFLVHGEGEYFTRFQGWGWATTGQKLKKYVGELIYLYSLTENDYLEFVDRSLSDEVVARLDVTPGRQPTDTIKCFFAWDEALALLTALDGQMHKKTPVRTVYNFGACDESSRFKHVSMYTNPPFNMVSHDEIWDYF